MRQLPVANRNRKTVHRFLQVQLHRQLEILQSRNERDKQNDNNKNCIFVKGPSNVGKTLLLKNMLSEIIPFHAIISTLGNSSEFLWQPMVGSRVVFCEEMGCGPEQIEMMKLLFGGEPTVVSIKHKEPGITCRTPFVVTGNSDPWLTTPQTVDLETLKNRMITFKVNEWRKLKETTKKPNLAV